MNAELCMAAGLSFNCCVFLGLVALVISVDRNIPRW